MSSAVTKDHIHSQIKGLFDQITDEVGEAVVDAINAAVRQEREECAKLCEGSFDSEMRGYGDYFAKLIRARAALSLVKEG